MEEQLIRQQTAVLLDAYRELTGSTEIPGIGDFLKLRETAIREGDINLKGETVKAITKKPIQKVSEYAPQMQKDHIEKMAQYVDKKENSEKKKKEPATIGTHKYTNKSEPRKEENSFEKQLSEKDDFAMLRSIQDPWNR